MPRITITKAERQARDMRDGLEEAIIDALQARDDPMTRALFPARAAEAESMLKEAQRQLAKIDPDNPALEL